MHYYIIMGMRKEVEFVLNLEGISTENVVDKYGCTPLLLASCRGDHESVSLLLQKGASVDNKQGRRALEVAHKSENKELSALLTAELDKPSEGKCDNDGGLEPPSLFSLLYSKVEEILVGLINGDMDRFGEGREEIKNYPGLGRAINSHSYKSLEDQVSNAIISILSIIDVEENPARRSKYVETLEFILTVPGVDVTHIMQDGSSQGQTPVHHAFIGGPTKNIDIQLLFLRHSSFKMDAKDGDGDTVAEGYGGWRKYQLEVSKRLAEVLKGSHIEVNSMAEAMAAELPGDGPIIIDVRSGEGKDPDCASQRGGPGSGP